MKNVIRSIFLTNLGVRETESVLVVVDKKKKEIGKMFFEEGKRLAKRCEMVEIPVGKINGEEPPAAVAAQLLQFDVSILITSKSLSHTKARKNACLHGARIATLPGVNEDMLMRCVLINYKKMHALIDHISDKLDNAHSVRITSNKGTDLHFSIEGRKAYGRHSGIFVERGDFGNLPDGESFIAPVEGTAEGRYIIDGSVKGIGKVGKPVLVEVSGGVAMRVSGGRAAELLSQQLTKYGKKSRNIAEFGIGTNDKAGITGNLLEDEKVLGTCHIALGNNTGFGGKTEVPFHVDGLIKKPTILIDGKVLMKNGVFKAKLFK